MKLFNALDKEVILDEFTIENSFMILTPGYYVELDSKDYKFISWVKTICEFMSNAPIFDKEYDISIICTHVLREMGVHIIYRIISICNLKIYNNTIQVSEINKYGITGLSIIELCKSSK